MAPAGAPCRGRPGGVRLWRDQLHDQAVGPPSAAVKTNAGASWHPWSSSLWLTRNCILCSSSPDHGVASPSAVESVAARGFSIRLHFRIPNCQLRRSPCGVTNPHGPISMLAGDETDHTLAAVHAMWRQFTRAPHVTAVSVVRVSESALCQAQLVPYVIWQTWKDTYPSTLRFEGMNSMVLANPEYDYAFMTDADCTRFICELGDPDVRRAYEVCLSRSCCNDTVPSSSGVTVTRWHCSACGCSCSGSLSLHVLCDRGGPCLPSLSCYSLHGPCDNPEPTRGHGG